MYIKQKCAPIETFTTFESILLNFEYTATMHYLHKTAITDITGFCLSANNITLPTL